MHVKVIEYVRGGPMALCLNCDWRHEGTHQSIIEEWHTHQEEVGEQLCTTQ